VLFLNASDWGNWVFHMKNMKSHFSAHYTLLNEEVLEMATFNKLYPNENHKENNHL
jgi:hypothetical protein